MLFHSVPHLIEELKQGRMIIIVDDKNRENEGDLVLPADFVTPESINFMSLKARGLICVSLTYEQTEQLGLPLMVDSEKNLSQNKTAFTVSVEAAKGVSTGISPADRAHTIKAVSSPTATARDIITPGHVFPIRAHRGGVLKRAGHTEASVDFCKLAGLQPAAVICEIISPDGNMARLPELKKFSKKHKIKIGSIEDLIRYRLINESFVEETVSAPFVSNLYKGFQIRVFQDQINDREHLVFTKGDITDGKPVLVRVHSACVTGDLFGGQATKSGEYLYRALDIIDKAGKGILIYLRLEDSPGKLAHRVNSYLRLKKSSSKKDQSTRESPHPSLTYDKKDYGVGAQILRSLKVSQIILLSNFQQKRVGLKGYGLEIVKTMSLIDKVNPKIQKMKNI